MPCTTISEGPLPVFQTAICVLSLNVLVKSAAVPHINRAIPSRTSDEGEFRRAS